MCGWLTSDPGACAGCPIPKPAAAHSADELDDVAAHELDVVVAEDDEPREPAGELDQAVEVLEPLARPLADA